MQWRFGWRFGFSANNVNDIAELLVRDFNDRDQALVGNHHADSVDMDECESVATLSGDINVKGNVKGNLKSTSGDIRCGNVEGSVFPTSGDVECQNIGGSVNTVSGDI
ncbi:MAG: hypothetical protein M0P12_03200 [Paludibacteraceae bacterium]|nr:hypothetical protein [Paludibacteraceae bacterium]